ncbi:MAG: 50S ribosomal protein L25, partial [Desulfovibrio sp.]|nr:50S ribosomal protein L25 [Desulfovibrio sp.]
IKVEVPIEFVGTAKGVKLGGVLETYRENVRLGAKPLAMPKKITVDVSNMNIGDVINVSELELPANVRAVYDQNYAVVGVMAKSKETAEEETSAEEPAQA